MTGKVYIVGAGPGDPELLTLKAMRAINGAQVVVYDRLVSASILDLVPSGAARIFAGKECKKKAMTQEEINDLLVMLARKGKRVVRLKGGDPFIFGRGGEEALHLVKQGIAFEVVPGITTASASAAIAGIPLTHRGLATGVRYVTGHLQNEQNEPDWREMANADTTLVIYMGLARIGHIAKRLNEAGLPGDFPVAVIENATLPQQRVLTGTLENIAAKVQAAEFVSPALIIVGRVVTLHAQLQGVSGKPSVRSQRTEARPARQSRRRCV